MADHMVVGNIDFGKPLSQTMDRCLLIGLAGTQPHITDQNISDDDLVHLKKIGSACRLRRQSYHPLTVISRLRFIIRTIEAYRDHCTGICPAPDIKVHITLQYHTVAYKFGKTNITGDK